MAGLLIPQWCARLCGGRARTGRWHTVGRSVREQRHRLQLHRDRRGVRLQPPAHVRRGPLEAASVARIGFRVTCRLPLPWAGWGTSTSSPSNGHGTHVAGIIGGAGGLCPDIQLYDYRVLGEDGRGNEFAVVAAASTHRRSHTQGRRRRPRQGAARRSADSRRQPLVGTGCRCHQRRRAAGRWSVGCATSSCVPAWSSSSPLATPGFEDRTGALRSTGQDYRTASHHRPRKHRAGIITVGSHGSGPTPGVRGVVLLGTRTDGRRAPKA